MLRHLHIFVSQPTHQKRRSHRDLGSFQTSQQSFLDIKMSSEEQENCLANPGMLYVLLVIPISFLVLFVVIVMGGGGGASTEDDLITKLRKTPAHKLHEKVEKIYHLRFRGLTEDPQDERPTLNARYLSITHQDDLVTGKRTITIVEDLNAYERRNPRHDLESQHCIMWPEVRNLRHRREAQNEEVTRLLASFSDRVVDNSQALVGQSHEVPAPGSIGQEENEAPPPYASERL